MLSDLNDERLVLYEQQFLILYHSIVHLASLGIYYEALEKDLYDKYKDDPIKGPVIMAIMLGKK